MKYPKIVICIDIINGNKKIEGLSQGEMDL